MLLSNGSILTGGDSPMFSIRTAMVLLSGLLAAAPVRAAETSDPIDLTARDTTCSPCRDFFRYANGAWLDRTEIPATHPGFGSFQALDDRNEDNLHALLEDAWHSTSPDANVSR